MSADQARRNRATGSSIPPSSTSRTFFASCDVSDETLRTDRDWLLGPASQAERPTRYHRAVPLYEYRCRVCDDHFEVRRPMSESGAPATCPDGHIDTVRLLSMFASAGAPTRPTGAPAASTGGCCGGGCGCRH